MGAKTRGNYSIPYCMKAAGCRHADRRCEGCLGFGSYEPKAWKKGTRGQQDRGTGGHNGDNV